MPSAVYGPRQHGHIGRKQFAERFIGDRSWPDSRVAQAGQVVHMHVPERRARPDTPPPTAEVSSGRECPGGNEDQVGSAIVAEVRPDGVTVTRSDSTVSSGWSG
jgi:hypothetical protein